jgi:hypothetical protein
VVNSSRSASNLCSEGRLGTVTAISSPGKLFVSHAHPDTAIVFGSFISLSHDRGATWSRISPESDFVIGYSNIADTPDGRFIASVDQLGFVSFQ